MRRVHQYTNTVQVPTIAQQVKEALAAGQCCVIGLQTTGESALEDAVGTSLLVVRMAFRSDSCLPRRGRARGHHAWVHLRLPGAPSD